jgi:hypothetical protein
MIRQRPGFARNPLPAEGALRDIGGGQGVVFPVPQVLRLS